MNNYDISVPVFLRGFRNLLQWLVKAEEFARSETVMAEFVATSLAPDMFTLRGQIQVATEMAKGCGARLSGTQAPIFANDEANIEQLRDRIAVTVSYLEKLTPEQFALSETQEVSLVIPYGTLEFSSQNYILQFSLPNFFFHLSTAYDILRYKGVPLGKMDYLGRFP
ncbi:DUF1993 family protein [Pseudomonas sp. NPDC088368]|uniref:DUF1993 domain-containing protein n=1 Tax=Pseudomonas sp. NPDC088368 TaxID=3364453 RepID=UPI003828EB58